MAIVARQLTTAVEGQRKVVFLSGEAGIGKTALASNICNSAEPMGFTSLWGRCWEAGDAPAFWPWARILDHCAEIVGQERYEGLLESACARHELPVALRSKTNKTLHDSSHNGAVAMISEHSRMRLFEAIKSIVKQATDIQPIVMVFDDLHAADQSSVLLLLYVIGELEKARLFLVLAYRSVELEQNQNLQQLVAKLARYGDELALSGLSQEQVKKYHQHVTGQLPKPDFLEKISKVSSGNPLFLSELLRLSELDQDGGAPLKLQDVIQRRLDTLPEKTFLALRYGALLGREFSAPIVSAACGLNIEELRTHLKSQAARTVVRPIEVDRYSESNAPVSDFEFIHDFFRQTCISRLDPGSKQLMHKQLAVTLEMLSMGAESATNTIARHFYSAIPISEPETAIRWLNKAARLSNRSGSYEEADQLSSMALLAIAASTEAGSLKALALLNQGRSAMSLGQFKRAKSLFEAGFEIAVDLADGELAVQHALGYGSLSDIGRPLPKIVSKLQRALTLIDPESYELRALVLARLSDCLQYSSRRTDGIRFATEARELVSQSDNPVTQAQVLLLTVRVLQTPDNLEERICDAHQVIDLAQQAGNDRLELSGHEDLIRHAAEAGDAVLADRHMEIQRQIAEETGHSLGRWLAIANAATRKCIDGEREAATELSNQALEYGHANSNNVAWLNHTVLSHDIWWLEGTLEKAIPSVEETCRKAPHFSAGFTGMLWAQAHATDDFASIIAELNRYADTDFSDVPFDNMWLVSMRMLAEAATMTNAKHAAEAIYRKLAPYEGSHAAMFFTVYRGSIARPLGMLQHCLGNFEVADKHFERAIIAEQRMRAKGYETFARLDRAAALLDAGGATSLEIAQIEIAAVEEILNRLSIPRGEKQLHVLKARLSRNSSPHQNKPVAKDQWHVQLKLDKSVASLAVASNHYPLRMSKGLGYLATLLTMPNTPLQAHRLVNTADATDSTIMTSSEASASGLSLRTDMGSAGLSLDKSAVSSYKRRLEDLKELAEQAEQNNDSDSASTYRTEMEFIASELISGVGKSGVARETSDHNERARSAVTKAIKAAIIKISQVEPSLGRYLNDCIKTGHNCEYSPSGIPVVEWNVLFDTSSARK